MERLVFCNLSMNMTNAPGTILITPQALYFFFAPLQITSGGASLKGLFGGWVGSWLEQSVQHRKTNRPLIKLSEEDEFEHFSSEIQQKVKDVKGYRKFNKGNVMLIKRGWTGFSFVTGDNKKVSLTPLIKKNTFQEYLLENGYHISVR